MYQPINIKSLVLPKTKGIFWLSEEKFSFDLPGADEINYLLDGLLVQTLKNPEFVGDTHLFLSTNYGNPFFVFFANSLKKDSYQKIHHYIETNEDKEDSSGEFLFICDKYSKELQNEFNKLEKSFPRFTFIIKSYVH